MKPNYTYDATVTRVVDGDTIVADIDLGFNTSVNHVEIRLADFDAYETRRTKRARNQAEKTGMTLDEVIEAGKAALRFLYEEILRNGNHVTVRTYKTDSFGRWLADVWIGSKKVSKILLDNDYGLQP